ncbi:CBO0543 family protein [Neobacillus niacini]|uniref:CBO0543 family protein n=1 Tax=Neobacillus niacini TaxID=86668 RepID=UPI002866C646|nr:hypothetical protein [Neobacillus niacini]
MSNIYQLAIIVLTFTVSFRKKVWGNFDRCYPTLLYMVVGNLTYEYIAHTKFHLWELKQIGSIPEIWADLIYLFFMVVPATLIYLTNYPDTPMKRIFYIMKWVFIFTMVEWVGGRYFNAIDHYNGWNIWWSLFFNFVMFTTLRLHYLYYKRALIISVFWTLFYLIWFDYI